MHTAPPMKYFRQKFKPKSDPTSESNYEPIENIGVGGTC